MTAERKPEETPRQHVLRRLKPGQAVVAGRILVEFNGIDDEGRAVLHISGLTQVPVQAIDKVSTIG